MKKKKHTVGWGWGGGGVDSTLLDEVICIIFLWRERNEPNVISRPFVCFSCKKGELFDYLNQVVMLSEKRTRQVMRQLLEAVIYVHDKSIVHRDLKVSKCNVIVCLDVSETRWLMSLVRGLIEAVHFCQVNIFICDSVVSKAVSWNGKKKRRGWGEGEYSVNLAYDLAVRNIVWTLLMTCHCET